jgi:4-amino-4-deoxy-L-arabinose transferase-like glycosyltransferase
VSAPAAGPGAWLSRRAGGIAFVLCAAYALALAYPVHRHVVGVFSDFYRFYAPDADRIAAGQFPANTYNPPGYPALLALVSTVTGDHFASGKWLSLLAGALAGALAFHLHRRLFGAAAALMAVPIMLSSPTFTTYAITAMTDVLFVAVALGALLAITAPPAPRRQILAGALTGAAYLVRYNGAFLLLPGLAGALTGGGPGRARVKRAALYLGAALLVAAPWFWLNLTHHGSPLYSTNYRDVAREHLPHVDAGALSSLVGVLAYDPVAFARSYARHLVPTLANSFGASLALFPVGPLAALGMVLSGVRRRRRPVLLVLLAALGFLLFMSLTHWERRYFLFLLACYSGFAAHAIAELARGAGRALRTPWTKLAVAAALMLLIVVPSVVRSAQVVRTTLERQPLELLPAARFLDRVAPPGAPVMAVRAQIAYLSRRPWQETPDARSLDELRALLGEHPPAYLVYDRWGRFRAGLRALATPDPAMSWLRPVFNDGGVVIYAVEAARGR